MWNCLFRVKDNEVRFRVKDNESFAAKLYSQSIRYKRINTKKVKNKVGVDKRKCSK